MSILTVCTPEVALLFFAFLVLFFVSISFPSSNATLIMAVLYVWRACTLALADLVQTYVSPDFKNIDYALMAADVAAFLFVYWLFKRMAFARPTRMPWFAALVMNVLTAGLFVSTLFLLFPLELGNLFPRIGPMLFATSAMNAAWLFLPLAFSGILHVMPKKILQKKLKIQ